MSTPRSDTPHGPTPLAPAQAEQYEDLLAALDDVLRQGLRVPCHEGPHREDWISDSAKDQGKAANACLECPLMDECRDYGLAWEPAGVWGAMTRTERNTVRQQTHTAAA